MIVVDCLPLEAASADIYRRLYALAREERRQRAERYIDKEDSVRCIVADALLRRALAMSGMPEDAPLERGEHGKPYLRESDFFFNLSHSGDWVVIAYSNREVGVDVERIELRSNREQIARRCFDAKERSYVFCDDDPFSVAQRFTEVWCAKESYLKYLGTGLSEGLDAVCVDIESGSVPSDTAVALYPAMLDASHCLCVCAAPDDDIVLRVLDAADLFAV